MTRNVVLAIVALVIAVALVIIRLELAGERAALADGVRSRDRGWDNCLLPEQRSMHGNRVGAFLAMAAATGRNSEEIDVAAETLSYSELRTLKGITLPPSRAMTPQAWARASRNLAKL